MSGLLETDGLETDGPETDGLETESPKASRHVVIAALLIDIEAELRTLGWWDGVQPSIEALSSTMPFAADTLAFYQWVQFIFLPRMHVVIDQQLPLPLPSACGIAPMLEEYSRVSGRNPAHLLQLFAKMDGLLSMI